MNRGERRRFLRADHQGLAFGGRRQRLSLKDSFTNLVLVAPTGSGKTTRYVIPNVLLATGSVVVTDPSGEIFRATSGHLKKRGFLIQVLAPADLESSRRFNPLHYWKTPQELRRLATLLVTSSLGSATADSFWSMSATNVLFFTLVALRNAEPPDWRHLGNLRGLLNQLDVESSGSSGAFFVRHLREDFVGEYRAFMAMESKVRSSILATARAAVDLWSDPDVVRFTAENSVGIDRLRQKLTAIFLIVPEHQVGYFGQLANLFYSTCFAHCLETGRSADELPVFFFLDEFGNMGAIHEIATVMTTLRKRRCSISLILQELSQLRAVYGADQARTIFSGGAANKLFFAGLDLETAKYVEELLGQNTEYDTTFGGIDAASRTVGVPLMKTDEIRMLPPEQAILVSGRQRPALLKMPPFYRVREWRERPPEQPPKARGGTPRVPCSPTELSAP